MMKFNKKIVSGTIGLLAMFMLAGCEDTDSSHYTKSHKDTTVSIKKHMSYTKANEKFRAYKLEYFENVISHDDDSAYYQVAYYDGSQIVSKRYDSDDITEVVDTKSGDTPYVIISKDKENIVIHRLPYMTYNQAPVSGKVTTKED